MGVPSSQDDRWLACPICGDACKESEMVDYVSLGGFFPNQKVCPNCALRQQDEEDQLDWLDELEQDVDQDLP